ncbi:MAG: response regulator [Planctomycetes bacterium]|nr:response regulator [Planctomycetota bacterium]
MLQDRGYSVREAQDGRVALEECLARRPDVMILDLIMPKKDGIETMQEARRVHPDLKIIAISGGGVGNPHAYLRLASKLGADCILAKPFSIEEVVKAVEDALGRERPTA